MSAPIDEDDKARMAQSEVKLLGITVEKLKSVSELTAEERRFVEAMDLQLNVFRKIVERGEVQRIKDLAWKYRRKMPSHLAPKLPPYDPIVVEMGL